MIKLNKLRSIANQLLRESSKYLQEYMVDPFYHYTPKNEILIDLKSGTFSTDLGGDDVERYYTSIINWLYSVIKIIFHQLNIKNLKRLKNSVISMKCFNNRKLHKYTRM